jgi:SAM-dependent methyltransferase
VLEWTGERFLPWIKEATISYEHLHRYAYAAALVKDKVVLDLACGEGYGSRMLSQRAASVVGIDIDESVVRHASNKYAGGNLQFVAGSITDIPIPEDYPFDVIVCFEAIEHIEDQEKLLSEVKRLLKPRGTFIVSTPNKTVYGNESSEQNPFHARELDFEEFHQLVGRHFENIRFLGQRVHPSSSIWPIAGSSANGFHEFVIERGDSTFEFIAAKKRVPVYFIAVASSAAGVPAQPGSILIDHSDGLIEEKNQRIKWLEQKVAERDQTIGSLEEAVRWREGQVRELEEAVKWQQGQVRELEEAVQWQQGQVRDLSDQIASLQEAVQWQQGQVRDLSDQIASLQVTVQSQQEQQKDLSAALAAGARQVSDLETSKEHLERENVSLAASLQSTQDRLNAASSILAGIHASRGWRLIVKLRQVRNSLTGLVKSRA